MSNKTVYLLSGIVIVVSVLLEILFAHHYTYYWWQSVISFDVFFGFIGCVLIIVVAKAFGKKFVQRDENYYRSEDLDD